MSAVVEQPRHFCMLGAKQSVVAIERAVPIVHAGPGCSSKLWSGLSFCNGFQGAGYAGGSAVPSTNTGEREVVFGGEGRLREVIEGALKVMDGDLFVVLTGCTSDIVGDDTAQVVREFRERGVPIVHAETGGFKGTSFAGHEALLDAIIRQFLGPARETIPNLVNVFASVPYLDPFWSGNLEGLRELLAGIGLEANILFGPGSGGIEAWRKIPVARFNLVVSPWVGVKAAQLLEERYGTPWLHYPVLPVGGTETSRFLATVGEFAGIDRARTEAFIRREEERFYYYLERAADFILEFRYDLPGRFVTVCDSLYALGVSRFLVNDLGLLPGEQFVTDQTPPEHRDALRGAFAALSPSVAAPVTFTPDGGAVQRHLREARHHRPPLIIGSTWDKDIAAELKGYQVSLSLPVTDRLVLDRSYVGYRGGLRLAEDIYGAILGSYQ
ncbi:nitrogenase component 1 [Geobacter pickeringii]|uniref:Hydrogenase n=1 Tax=Geobacter pickeringii TaxID=345632 RepID=A0A0B5BC89_9BACT|nr:nitrogenase component 1 [Geobacter pickeringii]AJE02175.1 hydrogenase [Geobacter pickeringii]